MNTKRYAFMIAAATSCIQAHHDPFESMHNSMQAIQKEMVNMFDHMNKMHEQFYNSIAQTTSKAEQGINIAINDLEQNNAVQVVISGITSEQFEANFNDKELLIKSPSATITLSTHHNILGVGVIQEIKEESNADDKKESGFFSSSSHIHQMIAKPIDLEKAAIEYNKDQRSLTIEIPYKEPKKSGKVIPVNVK